MKLIPFIISTVCAAVALVLSVIHFTSGASNIKLQGELRAKQQVLTEINDAVDEQQRELQRQQPIIQAGADVVQKYGPPILRDIGLLTAKNKNEKLKNILVRQKLEAYIPTDEQLKQIEEQIRKQQGAGAGAASPAPAPGPAPANLTPPAGTPR